MTKQNISSLGQLEASVKEQAAKIQKTVKARTQVLSEALVLVPKSFILKTEQLSATAKETHLSIYKNLVDSFNKISSRIDAIQKNDPRTNNPNDSDFRRDKLDEQHNLNGAKLHELYFSIISDLNSDIRQDTIPYMRLVRDWGTFDAWQLDFRACGMNAMEGWAVLFFDPYKQKYMNTFIERNTDNIPVGAIPVLVVDAHHHAWFFDYPGEKLEYMNAMMNEINWAVVEARMLIAEMSQLHKLYMIEPVGATETPKSIALTPFEPPIGKDKITPTANVQVTTKPGPVQ